MQKLYLFQHRFSVQHFVFHVVLILIMTDKWQMNNEVLLRKFFFKDFVKWQHHICIFFSLSISLLWPHRSIYTFFRSDIVHGYICVLLSLVRSDTSFCLYWWCIFSLVSSSDSFLIYHFLVNSSFFRIRTYIYMLILPIKSCIYLLRTSLSWLTIGKWFDYL